MRPLRSRGMSACRLPAVSTRPCFNKTGFKALPTEEVAPTINEFTARPRPSLGEGATGEQRAGLRNGVEHHHVDDGEIGHEGMIELRVAHLADLEEPELEALSFELGGLVEIHSSGWI